MTDDRERVTVVYTGEQQPTRKVEFVPLDTDGLWLRKVWMKTTTGDYQVTGTEHVRDVQVQTGGPSP